MKYAWHDFAGNLGVASMMLSYLLLQLGKLRIQDPRYSFVNAVGALLVLLSLIYRFNLSAFFVELFWLLISLYGLIKFAMQPKQSEGR